MKTLADWRSFAEVQMRFIEQRMEAHKGTHHVPADRELTAEWMQGEAFLVGGSLERAIQHFIATQEWPALTDEELFYLLHRLKLARMAVDFWIKNEGSVSSSFMPAPPDSTAEAEFISWMFVDIWKALGAGYLTDWVADLLRRFPPCPHSSN
jgi:hypothetical protein